MAVSIGVVRLVEKYRPPSQDAAKGQSGLTPLTAVLKRETARCLASSEPYR